MSDESAEALGRAIRVLRTDRGISRKDVAEASGLSYPFLSEIESGRKRPSSRALESIATALGVRPHDLLAMADARRSQVWLADERASFPQPMMASAPSRPSARAELEDLLDELPERDLRL